MPQRRRHIASLPESRPSANLPSVLGGRLGGVKPPAPRASGISRRELLAGAAVGAGSLISAPTAIAASRGQHRPGLWSQVIGPVTGRSRVMQTQRRFALAGIEWHGQPEARIWLRARLPSGRWSQWALASVGGHGPDGLRRAASHFGEPLWSGGADAIQLRTDAPVGEVRAHFVAVSAPVTSGDAGQAAAAPLAQPILNAGPGQPPIIARSAWAHGHAPPKYPPAYGAVNLAFVHHTDNLNGYSAAQVPAMLFAMYQFHRYVRGWNDIGYNFVIDAFGRIWEARDGGVDLPVVGAQAGGYNLESTGVAVLGTFSGVLPSAAAIGALEQLLAWKLALHGLPATGDVTVEVNPGDAFYTPYKGGTLISLPRVAGHRQGCTTDCPGNAFFAKLPATRRVVARLAGTPAALTLALPGPSWTPASSLSVAQTAITAGQTLTATGVLTSLAGVAVAGAPVVLQEIAAGRRRTLATAVTDPQGNWSATLTPTRNALVRALHAAAPASASPVVAIAVAPVVTLRLVGTSPLVVAGTVNPPQPHVTVDVYRSGRVKPVASKTVAAERGTFAARLPLPRSGRYDVRARTPATAQNAAGGSALVAVS